MTTELSDLELADRQLTYDELKETKAWELLTQRVEEIEMKFAQQLGQGLIRATRTTDSTISDQMLRSFVDVAFHRGVIRGMGLVIREPERIAEHFNKAFEEKKNG